MYRVSNFYKEIELRI